LVLAAGSFVAAVAIHVGRTTDQVSATSPLTLHPDVQRDEIDLGRRAVRVARSVQDQLKVCKDRSQTSYRLGDSEGKVDAAWRATCYEREFSSFNHWVGGDWGALIADLDARSLLIRPTAHYVIGVNWTGVDDIAREVERIGHGLLRSHGLNEAGGTPPSSAAPATKESRIKREAFALTAAMREQLANQPDPTWIQHSEPRQFVVWATTEPQRLGAVIGGQLEHVLGEYVRLGLLSDVEASILRARCQSVEGLTDAANKIEGIARGL
jgi:hypothetical protein